MSDMPDFVIHVNGQPLRGDVRADILALTVTEDLAVTSMATIELVNWDSRHLRLSWSDARLFQPGAELDIWMGYGSAPGRVFMGEIVGMEASFQAEAAPRVTVRAYDHRHRLARGRQTRSFAKAKDSEIARVIAQQAGLAAEVVDTRVTLDYVLQRNQADLAFLRERAGRLGYEVFVRDKRLQFRPPGANARPVLQLNVASDLLEFSARYSTVGQVGEVEVHGWDVAGKQPYSARARAGLEQRIATGRTNRAALGTAVLHDVDTLPQNPAEATAIAQGRLDQIALGSMQAEGRCRGRPALRAGVVAAIEGAGTTFSGDYYLTTVVHSYDLDEGYVSEFVGRRAMP